MGDTAAAAIVAHQPMIMAPEHVRVELGGTGADSTLVEPGFRLLRDHLAAARVDTLVIIDTHWFTTTEHVIAGASHFCGKYTSEELPRSICDLPYDYPGSPELAALMHSVGKDRRVPTVNVVTPSLPLHYPTINLVHHLRTDQQVLSVSVLQTAELGDFVAFGEVIAEAVARSDRRVALLGSGGMSHRFWTLAQIRHHLAYGTEHIVSDEARRWDADILELWAKGDHRGALDAYPQYRAVHPEGFFGHYLILVGAIGGVTCTAVGRQLSDYENAVGTGQVHVVFDLAGRLS